MTEESVAKVLSDESSYSQVRSRNPFDVNSRVLIWFRKMWTQSWPECGMYSSMRYRDAHDGPSWMPKLDNRYTAGSSFVCGAIPKYSQGATGLRAKHADINVISCLR